jgi:RNA 3'-terminal phosphate cyclase-like protein
MVNTVFLGCALFRARIVTSIISGKSIIIKDIRSEDDSPGIQDFEANFLRLIEKIADGCRIEINESGTVLKFKPGVITGGSFTHDCGVSKCIGWFIEGILPLAVFAKAPISAIFNGITNHLSDLSVDILRNVTIPLLRNFGIEGIELKIRTRGAYPNGGGAVEFSCPIVRELQPLHVLDMGRIKRVRGVAFCSRVSPTIATRLVDSARSVLNQFLPDVYIHTDHYRGEKAGLSAGYSLSLVAGTNNHYILL